MIAVAPVAPLLRNFGNLSPLAAPQLAVADHANGTGATATISGAPPGGLSTIFVQNFAGQLGAGQWQTMATIPANGDVAMNLSVGHYFIYAVVTLGGVSAVTATQYFVVSDGLESLHARCVAAAQARIRSLALAGVPNENVVMQKLPAVRNQLRSVDGLPAVIVSPHRADMPQTLGTNAQDDVHYDVLVAIVDRDNQEPTLAQHLDRHLLWRQQIARAFRNQRLPGVSEIIDTTVESAEGLLEDAWKRELAASAVLLRFTSRETRGF